jgi:hypothetical protein
MSGLSGRTTDDSTASLIVPYNQNSKKWPAHTKKTGEVITAFAQLNKEVAGL